MGVEFEIWEYSTKVTQHKTSNRENIQLHQKLYTTSSLSDRKVIE